MKKLLLGCVAAGALLTSPALAADMPVKARPAPPVGVNWTGFYVGVGGGYGMYDLDTQVVTTATGVPVGTPLDQAGRGWFGTAQIGFDYQFAPHWVAGAFVDGDVANIHGSHTGQSGAVGLVAGDMKLSQSWAVGGRVGYLVDPLLLSYVSGGFTQAHFDGTTYAGVTGAPSGLAVGSQDYNGYFIGGGVEYALGWLPGLFWKTEYRFADYRSQTLPVFATATGLPNGAGEVTHPYVQTVRSELVWRFGGIPGVAPKAMPVQAPAMAQNWNGFYVGVGGGYGMFDHDTQLVTAATGVPINVSLDQGGRGWFGTAQIGFDYQVLPRWVAGAFVDGDLANIHGSHTGQSTAFVGLVAGDMKLSQSWAVGGRVGYLVNPSLLSYVSGGFTQAHFDGTTYATIAGVPSGFAVPSQDYNGYFIGGGAEYALGWLPGLFWKTEYRFADYKSQTLPVFATATGVPTAFGEATHPYVQTIRTELVWRFSSLFGR